MKRIYKRKRTIYTHKLDLNTCERRYIRSKQGMIHTKPHKKIPAGIVGRFLQALQRGIAHERILRNRYDQAQRRANRSALGSVVPHTLRLGG